MKLAVQKLFRGQIRRPEVCPKKTTKKNNQKNNQNFHKKFGFLGKISGHFYYQ